MAGKHGLKIDPAIERWNRMREDAHMHFRWTPRTAKVAFIGVVLVPAMIYYAAATTDMKWNFRAKGKGSLLTERNSD